MHSLVSTTLSATFWVPIPSKVWSGCCYYMAVTTQPRGHLLYLWWEEQVSPRQMNSSWVMQLCQMNHYANTTRLLIYISSLWITISKKILFSIYKEEFNSFQQGVTTFRYIGNSSSKLTMNKKSLVFLMFMNTTLSIMLLPCFSSCYWNGWENV